MQVKTTDGKVKEYTLQQIDPNRSLNSCFPVIYCTDMKIYPPLCIEGNCFNSFRCERKG